jgi:hypothetical protein
MLLIYNSVSLTDGGVVVWNGNDVELLNRRLVIYFDKKEKKRKKKKERKKW